MEDKDVEKCVEEQDDVWFDGHAVQKYWLRWSVKRVGHQSRLDHD